MKPSPNRQKGKRACAMKPSSPHQTHQRTFLWVVLGCIALAVGYTSWGIVRANASGDYDPPKWVSVFVVPADGSGKPKLFIKDAISPVVVR
jgi:hypothetical protein